MQKFSVFQMTVCFSTPLSELPMLMFCILQKEYYDLYVRRRKLFALGILTARQQCVLQDNGLFAILL